mgnify:CR=1 FL=1
MIKFSIPSFFLKISVVMEHKYVFISYSSASKAVADVACHILEECGILCWISPHNIIPDKTWAGNIVLAICECSLIVLIYSEDYNSPSQVANEMGNTFSHSKIIITFMVDSTSMNNDFNNYLSRKYWLVTFPGYKQMLMPLVEAVATKIRVEIQRPQPSPELRQRVGKHPVPRTYPQPVVNTKRPWMEWCATSSVRSNSTTEWQLLLLLSVEAYVPERTQPVKKDRGRRMLRRY